MPEQLNDMDAVITYCKSNRVFLYAAADERCRAVMPKEMWQYRHSLLDDSSEEPGIRILYRAASFPSDEAHDNQVTNGLASADSGIRVPSALLDELNQALPDEDSDVRRLSTWPITRAFVYFDVSDFTRYVASKQLLIITSLDWLCSDNRFRNEMNADRAFANIEQSICIGDGYIFVVKEPVWAAYFAAYLACLVEVMGARGRLECPFHFRIGVHVGPVYSFWDKHRGMWNYVGDGINGGQRVLGAMGKDTDDVVYVSSALRASVLADRKQDFPANKLPGCMSNMGRRIDKQGRQWRIYMLDHSAVAGDYLPSIATEQT